MFDNPLVVLLGVIFLAIIIGLIVYIIIDFTSGKRHQHYIFGGCEGTRWGCCPDDITPKYDHQGSNCIPQHHHHHKGYVGGCSGTRWGCCPDGRRAKKDRRGSNC